MTVQKASPEDLEVRNQRDSESEDRRRHGCGNQRSNVISDVVARGDELAAKKGQSSEKRNLAEKYVDERGRE